MIEKQHSNVLELFENRDLVKIAAPMVRYSKIQFRTLLRAYNCDVYYTPMIMADSFVQSVKARRNEFTTNLCDTPLITQFASNDINDFTNAAKIVSPYCDGVDLNCGCPQRWAKSMGIGCVMLQSPELIFDLIRQCRNQILKPFTISVKMRILKNIKSTVEICRRLDKCDVSYLTIHGRTSSELTGKVDLSNFRLINENVSCPVVANGGVKSLQECKDLQQITKCKGVMVANGILTNPMLFSGSEVVDLDCIQNWVDICFNSTLSDYDNIEELSTENNTIIDKPRHLTFQCFHHHLVFMLEKILPRSRRRIFNNLQTFPDVLKFLDDELEIKPKLFKAKAFNNNRIIPIWSSSALNDNLNNDSYDYEANSGKYFKSKICTSDQVEDYHLENIFTEN